MEKSVIIPLSEYEKLVHIKNMAELPREHTVRIKSSIYDFDEIQTDSDVINKLAENLTSATIRYTSIGETLETVRKMSCREFRKWRKL